MLEKCGRMETQFAAGHPGHYETCDACGGSGGTDEATCGSCGGSGEVEVENTERCYFFCLILGACHCAKIISM